MRSILVARAAYTLNASKALRNLLQSNKNYIGYLLPLKEHRSDMKFGLVNIVAASKSSLHWVCENKIGDTVKNGLKWS